MRSSGPSRRDFMVLGGGAFIGAALTHSAWPNDNMPGRRRLAIVGTGGRGTSSWGRPAATSYKDIIDLVGLCDINAKRVEVAKQLMGTDAPTYVDFDRMVAETKPDVVLVTTVDSSHFLYIVRAMELGCDVISEKPLCTDEEQCQEILDAQKRTGKKVTVTFNARHMPEARKIKELLMDDAVGEVISLEYHEALRWGHGGSYFRRWHRLKENSGTLLVHKACHHFDQINWWLQSTPVEVVAHGDLRFYGKNGPFRSTHCRVCPFKQKCDFYSDVTTNSSAMRMYVDCESEDGYLIDGCVFRENINIYDTMSVMVKYANGVFVTYTNNAFLPYEGQVIGINGRKGRIDCSNLVGIDSPRKINVDMRLQLGKGSSQVLMKEEGQRGGGAGSGHVDADELCRRLVWRGDNDPDPLGLRADLRAGALASLLGIAAYKSIERGGEPIKIADLIRF